MAVSQGGTRGAAVEGIIRPLSESETVTEAGIQLDVLLPVHNEGASIGETLREIYEAVSVVTPMRFIISEDGSSDSTPEVLRQLVDAYPMKLISEPVRKGYSRAVLDGFALIEAPYVLCLDSDGQCDPADFANFWPRRDAADVLIGWRVNRQDTWLRRILSRSFGVFYRALFGVSVHDPSCPFILTRRSVIEQISPRQGVLAQGFWWEFVARVWAAKYSIQEIPVNHRVRAAGQTQVYRFSRMPRIGWTHLTGLVKIWREYH
jgi:glycosyltransferase involved in cell wall biosynthesis